MLMSDRPWNNGGKGLATTGHTYTYKKLIFTMALKADFIFQDTYNLDNMKPRKYFYTLLILIIY